MDANLRNGLFRDSIQQSLSAHGPPHLIGD
jgi:hypothetical protein